MLLTLFYWLAVFRLKLRLWLIVLFRNALFLELKQYTFSLIIKTEDSDTVRQISFIQGRLFTGPQNSQLNEGNNENPQAITVTFKNNSDAFEIARAIRKEKEKIFEFIQEQRVKIEGDFSVLQTMLQLKDKLDNS